MSQSTVTSHIQRLEKQMGYTLFHRMPNGVRLTASGLRFLPLAEQLLKVEKDMLRPNAADMQTLRIMSGRAFVSTDVPECLSRMVQTTPVRLDVRMGLYDSMVDALMREQVDFCFTGEPIYHAKVRKIEFLADPIDLVVPQHHHFTHHFPGLAALQGEPLIAFSDLSAPFRRRITKLLADQGVDPSVRMELDSLDGIKAMVSHGLGVSFLPRRTLGDANYKGYRIIPLNHPDWTRPTLLHYPATIDGLPLTKSFIDICTAYYVEQANTL